MSQDISQCDLKTKLKVDNFQKKKFMYQKEISNHQYTVNKSIFNKSGTVFATCSNDKIVYIYDSVTQTIINKFELTDAVRHINFLNKEDKIVIATGLGAICIYNIFEYQQNQDQTSFQYKNDNIRIICMDVSYGDKYLAILQEDLIPESKSKNNTLKLYEISTLVRDDSNTMVEEKYQIKFEPDEQDTFTFCRFGLFENVIFCARKDNYCLSYNFEKSTTIVENLQTPYLQEIKSLTFSPKFEFLLMNCVSGVALADPLTLDIFRIIRSPYPVLCSKVSPLMYRKQNPKFHLIFAGGIPQRDQAMQKEGGNEIFFFDISTGEKLFTLSGCNGTVNWISLFPDGMGLITASEEGLCRLFRFEKSYLDQLNQIFIFTFMNFLSNIFNTEVVPGYKIQKEEKNFMGGSFQMWKIYQGYRVKDKKIVSIFKINKKELQKQGNLKQKYLEFFIAESKQQTKIKHPSFLNIIEPFYEDTKNIVLVTEQIQYSLAQVLQTKNSNEIFEKNELKINLKKILEGLNFMHKTLNLYHLNVNPNTIFITVSGDWKLSGLGFVKPIYNNQVIQENQIFQQGSTLLPNLIYSNPQIFQQPNSNCDLYSFGLIIYHIFSYIKQKPNILPTRIQTQQECIQLNRQIIGIKKHYVLTVIPEEIKDQFDQILQDNQQLSIHDLLQNKWFYSKTIFLLEFIDSFMLKSEQSQLDFLCSFPQILNEFSKKLIENKIIQFLISQLQNNKLKNYALSVIILLIEKECLQISKLRNKIWLIIKNLFVSKHLNAQMIYVLVFYIDQIFKITQENEIEQYIFPFLMKCLICKHNKTQKLVLNRLNLILSKLQNQESFKQILIRLIHLWKQDNKDIVTESFIFLEQNLEFFQDEQNNKTLMKEMINFLQQTKQKTNVKVWDSYFDLLKKIYKNQDKQETKQSFKFFRLFLTILTEAKISRETFDECLKIIESQLESIKIRKNVIQKEITYMFLKESIEDQFKRFQIKSQDVQELISGQKQIQQKIKKVEHIEFSNQNLNTIQNLEKNKKIYQEKQLKESSNNIDFDLFEQGLKNIPKKDNGIDLNFTQQNKSEKNLNEIYFKQSKQDLEYEEDEGNFLQLNNQNQNKRKIIQQ